MRALSIFLLTSICLLLSASSEPQSHNDVTKPNILLIIGDDIGWTDFGCYGHPYIQTPHIDRLAERGLKFNRFFLTASSCSPSRCSIISGRYPHNNGAAELHTPLPESMIAFPALLQQAGYYTFQAGKTHMGPHAMASFSIAHGNQEGGPGGEERWVKSLQERPKDKPFFAWFASFDAHRAWQADPGAYQHKAEEVIVAPYLADTEATRQDLVAYYNEIGRLDRYVGAVVAELEAQGVLDNTLIILMADNGMPFPRAKTRVYDSGMQSPFIVHWPAGISEIGKTNFSLLSAVDIAPSLLEIAGVKAPDSYQGRSFTKLFTESEQPFRRFVFAEHNWHDFEALERSVRSQEYLYVLNERPNLANGGPADSKNSPSQKELNLLRDTGHLSAAQADIFQTPRPREELYAVMTDSLQLCNLASMPQYQPVLRQYRKALQSWREQSGDNTPQNITRDGFDRQTGQLREGVEAFNKVERGEMPGRRSGGLKATGHPGF
ncbi:MAG: sulfatase [Bacteroidota bacterium]